MQNILTTLETVISYMMGGRSVFTIVSQKSGKHYSFRVTQNKRNFRRFFVSARINCPSPNRFAFKYIGRIIYDHKDNRFESTPGSVVDESDLSFRSFKWYWEFLNNHKRLPANTTLYHHGSCSACGRRLTDPLSIERGMGATCWKNRRM
jgi:hypothetical protein